MYPCIIISGHSLLTLTINPESLKSYNFHFKFIGSGSLSAGGPTEVMNHSAILSQVFETLLGKINEPNPMPQMGQVSGVEGIAIPEVKSAQQ